MPCLTKVVLCINDSGSMHKELSAYVGISTSIMLSSLLACSMVDMACKTLLLLSTVWNVLCLIAGDLSAESQTPSDGAELVPSVQHSVMTDTALPAASHQRSLKPVSCAATGTANQAAGGSAAPSAAPPGLQPSAGHAAAASQPRLQLSSEGASASATGKMSTAITARQSDPAQKMTGNGAVGEQCSLCQLAIRCIQSLLFHSLSLY